jgi:rod shape-determining protein MreC
MTRIWDRIRDWVVLFSLLAITIGVMVAQNEPIIRAMRGTALNMTAWVESHFAWVGGYFRSIEENQFLRDENILLSSEVARSREALYENERLRSMLAMMDTTSFELLPAQIVGKDLTRQQNYLTLDVGANDGVREGMAVLDERGVIGRIVFVSSRYSRVMPYLNVDFRLPARVQEVRSEGVVRWEGNRFDHLLMEHVVKTDPVEPGHLVVTSGYSRTFPSGFPIGIVDSVAFRTGRNERYVYVRPLAPLDKVNFAFVLLELPDPELVEIESMTTTARR